MAASDRRPREMSDSGNIQMKRSATGTVKTEVGNSNFYSKFGIISINDSLELSLDKGGGSGGGGSGRSTVRVKKMTRIYDGNTKFPKLEDCAHFHYDFVELGDVQVALSEENQENMYRMSESDQSECTFFLAVSCGARSWLVRRTFENLRTFDRQLHRCIFDRKFSLLPELRRTEEHEEDVVTLRNVIEMYIGRFSQIAGNMINCGPVLSFLEMDNRGNRLIVSDDSAINTPAVSAAHVTKRYNSQANDEISFEVGDIISIIDMPPMEETIWWRGKRGFEVGFFPAECVQLLNENIPSSVTSKIPQTPPKPVLRKRGKLISFLRNFFTTRPARTQLKRSGIVKERVFGCDLGEHLLNADRDIPLLLECCAQTIETHGIVDGIYRLSGVASNIQKLRLEFDEDKKPNLTDECYLQDIHSISSLLKAYFRDLPNPLFTFQLYDQFITAMQFEDNRLMKIYDLVQQLPPPHYRTAQYLMQHLARVARHGHKTGMHQKNLAIVWAPNLLRSKELEQLCNTAALQGVGVQAIVTEYLISNADVIFSDQLSNLSLPGASGSLRKDRPKSLAISTPTKLLSLEEARERALSNTSPKQSYIEVGGGPSSLPEKYHTVIDIPNKKKSRKERKSPVSGWRSIFSKGKGQVSKVRGPERTDSMDSTSSLASSVVLLPGESEFDGEEGGGGGARRVLRTVRSADSLLSASLSAKHRQAGHSDPCTLINPYTDEYRDVRPKSSTLDRIKGTKRSISADNSYSESEMEPIADVSASDEVFHDLLESRVQSAGMLGEGGGGSGTVTVRQPSPGGGSLGAPRYVPRYRPRTMPSQQDVATLGSGIGALPPGACRPASTMGFLETRTRSPPGQPKRSKSAADGYPDSLASFEEAPRSPESTRYSGASADNGSPSGRSRTREKSPRLPSPPPQGSKKLLSPGKRKKAKAPPLPPSPPSSPIMAHGDRFSSSLDRKWDYAPPVVERLPPERDPSLDQVVTVQLTESPGARRRFSTNLDPAQSASTDSSTSQEMNALGMEGAACELANYQVSLTDEEIFHAQNLSLNTTDSETEAAGRREALCARGDANVHDSLTHFGSTEGDSSGASHENMAPAAPLDSSGGVSAAGERFSEPDAVDMDSSQFETAIERDRNVLTSSRDHLERPCDGAQGHVRYAVGVNRPEHESTPYIPDNFQYSQSQGDIDYHQQVDRDQTRGIEYSPHAVAAQGDLEYSSTRGVARRHSDDDPDLEQSVSGGGGYGGLQESSVDHEGHSPMEADHYCHHSGVLSTSLDSFQKRDLPGSYYYDEGGEGQGNVLSSRLSADPMTTSTTSTNQDTVPSICGSHVSGATLSTNFTMSSDGAASGTVTTTTATTTSSDESDFPGAAELYAEALSSPPSTLTRDLDPGLCLPPPPPPRPNSGASSTDLDLGSPDAQSRFSSSRYSGDSSDYAVPPVALETKDGYTDAVSEASVSGRRSVGESLGGSEASMSWSPELVGSRVVAEREGVPIKGSAEPRSEPGRIVIRKPLASPGKAQSSRVLQPSRQVARPPSPIRHQHVARHSCPSPTDHQVTPPPSPPERPTSLGGPTTFINTARRSQLDSSSPDCASSASFTKQPVETPEERPLAAVTVDGYLADRSTSASPTFMEARKARPAVFGEFTEAEVSQSFHTTPVLPPGGGTGGDLLEPISEAASPASLTSPTPEKPRLESLPTSATSEARDMKKSADSLLFEMEDLDGHQRTAGTVGGAGGNHGEQSKLNASCDNDDVFYVKAVTSRGLGPRYDTSMSVSPEYTLDDVSGARHSDSRLRPASTVTDTDSDTAQDSQSPAVLRRKKSVRELLSRFESSTTPTNSSGEGSSATLESDHFRPATLPRSKHKVKDTPQSRGPGKPLGLASSEETCASTPDERGNYGVKDAVKVGTPPEDVASVSDKTEVKSKGISARPSLLSATLPVTSVTLGGQKSPQPGDLGARSPGSREESDRDSSTSPGIQDLKKKFEVPVQGASDSHSTTAPTAVAAAPAPASRDSGWKKRMSDLYRAQETSNQDFPIQAAVTTAAPPVEKVQPAAVAKERAPIQISDDSSSSSSDSSDVMKNYRKTLVERRKYLTSLVEDASNVPTEVKKTPPKPKAAAPTAPATFGSKVTSAKPLSPVTSSAAAAVTTREAAKNPARNPRADVKYSGLDEKENDVSRDVTTTRASPASVKRTPSLSERKKIFESWKGDPRSPETEPEATKGQGQFTKRYARSAVEPLTSPSESVEGDDQPARHSLPEVSLTDRKKRFESIGKADPDTPIIGRVAGDKPSESGLNGDSERSGGNPTTGLSAADGEDFTEKLRRFSTKSVVVEESTVNAAAAASGGDYKAATLPRDAGSPSSRRRGGEDADKRISVRDRLQKFERQSSDSGDASAGRSGRSISSTPVGGAVDTGGSGGFHRRSLPAMQHFKDSDSLSTAQRASQSSGTWNTIL